MEFIRSNFIKTFLGPFLVVSSLYYLFARLGLGLTFINNSVSPIWPASGVAIAALRVYGIRLWPSVFVGAFIANFFNGSPLWISACIAAGNTSEAILGAYILNFYSKNEARFGQLNVLLGVVLTSIIPTVVSASVGNATLFAHGAIASDLLFNSFITWWVGDGLGTLVIVPFFFYARDLPTIDNRNIGSWFFSLRIPTLILVGIVAYSIFTIPKLYNAIFLLFPLLLITYYFQGPADSA